MAFFIPLLVGAGVAIVLTITIIVTKDSPNACYETEIEGRLSLLVTDFKFEILPSQFYDCDSSRPKTVDPAPSSCYRSLVVQFDGRETEFFVINMLERNTEYGSLPFKRSINDGFRSIIINITNYDETQYKYHGWLDPPLLLDVYRDTTRLEGKTRLLRWDRDYPMADDDGKNPQITTGNIKITLVDVSAKDLVVQCPSK